MKFRDEYWDPTAAHGFAAAISRSVTRPWTLMEVCGGQTHAIRPVRHRSAIAWRCQFGAWARLPSLRDTRRVYRQGD